MACQLDMSLDMKRWIFEVHFYVAQNNERVIAQFQDMKRDADHYSEAEYIARRHVMLVKMLKKSPSNWTSFLNQDQTSALGSF